MSEQNEQRVVDLVDAGVPADQGLASLGLLMQLAGNLFAAGIALFAFSMLFAGGGSAELLWLLLVLGLSITRSMLHRAAGNELLYGKAGLEQSSRTAGVRRYIMVALIQSVVTAALFAWKFRVPNMVAAGILAGLAAWPVALAILFQLPRFKRFANELPITEDKGFEGAAILMTVLGLCGLLAAATALILMVQAGGAMTKGAGVLIVLTTAMLVVRSFIHVQAGLSGLRETSIDKSVELANRYANFGVISSFCGGGALLLFVMSAAVSVQGMMLITGLVWMLMAWPLIIRRFFSDRQFADLLAGDNAPIHRRAPDAGLTALGWFLFAYAIFNASCTLPSLIGGSDMREFAALLGGTGYRSVWWSVGVIVLQGWAGFELIRMSPQSRIVATVYGAVGIGVTIYTSYPLLHELKHMRGMMGGSESLGFAFLALALVIPVATIVLVNRKIAPTARARFKSKPTPA